MALFHPARLDRPNRIRKNKSNFCEKKHNITRPKLEAVRMDLASLPGKNCVTRIAKTVAAIPIKPIASRNQIEHEREIAPRIVQGQK